MDPLTGQLCSLFVCVASQIAAPQEGDLSTGGGQGRIIAPGSEQTDGSSRRESQSERLQRLYDEGIRMPDPVPQKRDYLSVLRHRQVEQGVLPNLPPLLNFGFGFGSWFPLFESNERSSVGLGSHHISAQVYSFKHDKTAGKFRNHLPTSYAHLELYAVSFAGETLAPGFNADGEAVQLAAEVTDFDLGLDVALTWQKPAFQIGHWDTQLSLGYLPIKMRQLIRLGRGVPKDQDLLKSGVLFNATGLHLKGTFSYVAASLFELGFFTEVVGSFPNEWKVRIGLEVGMRSPRVFEKPKPAKSETSQTPKASPNEKPGTASQPELQAKPKKYKPAKMPKRSRKRKP